MRLGYKRLSCMDTRKSTSFNEAEAHAPRIPSIAKAVSFIAG